MKPIPIIDQMMVGVTTGGGAGVGAGGITGAGGAFSTVKLATGLQSEIVGSMPLALQK